MTEHHTRVKVTLSLYVDLATDSHPEDIDERLMLGMVEDNVVDAIQNALDGNLRESVSVWLDKYDFETITCLIPCSVCGESCDSKKAHLHQGVYIGECCWDERLKASE